MSSREQDWAEKFESGAGARTPGGSFLITPSALPPHRADLGCVSASVVKGTGPVSSIFSFFTDLFGQRSGAYEDKLRVSLNEVLMDLQIEAESRGATAVYNMRYQLFEASAGHGQLVVTAYGTAAR